MSRKIANKRILVVDDEPDVLRLVSSNLTNAGFNVVTAEDGQSAIAQARDTLPSLIVLDLMLPDMSGFEVYRILKKQLSTSQIPVIMLTAKAEVVDRIVGLEMGADDYLTKPFSPRELVLRVKSVIRRSNASPQMSEQLTVGGITIDRARCEITVDGKPLDLTATEFKLLRLLIERRGRVQSRETLLNSVWGYDIAPDTRTVDTYIQRLREKLGGSADCIETIRGVGYRLVESVG